MTIQECYKEFNGNYSEIIERLLTDARVEKFALRFLDTKDIEKLKEAVSKKDWNEAFVIAHTAKGLGLNLGFSNYAEVVSEITEILRPGTVDDSMIETLNSLVEKADMESNKIKDSLMRFTESKR